MSQKVSKVQLVMSDAYPPPNFHVIQEIIFEGDLMGMLSSILPKVIMIHNVRSCYMSKIGEVGDCEIREDYENLCDEGTLKEEFKIIERKGLTPTLEFLRNFRMEWIKVILRRVHDMKYWLKNGQVEITKKMIHKITCYLTLDKKKTM